MNTFIKLEESEARMKIIIPRRQRHAHTSSVALICLAPHCGYALASALSIQPHSLYGFRGHEPSSFLGFLQVHLDSP
ncbi:hypothetical protein MTTB_03570 [Methanothermobacter tenebrarum]|uniref:Uncharacterized protein n=1 Tax=Methanothermobacter tenebrarum TaxID=680118 RepID=A0ABM7YCM0_9EURY|nr:hypothetical protein MTTB_03570 [Methanothermobacter tenebrarum]